MDKILSIAYIYFVFKEFNSNCCCYNNILNCMNKYVHNILSTLGYSFQDDTMKTLKKLKNVFLYYNN